MNVTTTEEMVSEYEYEDLEREYFAGLRTEDGDKIYVRMIVYDDSPVSSSGEFVVIVYDSDFEIQDEREYTTIGRAFSRADDVLNGE